MCAPVFVRPYLFLRVILRKCEVRGQFNSTRSIREINWNSILLTPWISCSFDSDLDRAGPHHMHVIIVASLIIIYPSCQRSCNLCIYVCDFINQTKHNCTIKRNRCLSEKIAILHFFGNWNLFRLPFHDFHFRPLLSLRLFQSFMNIQ